MSLRPHLDAFHWNGWIFYQFHKRFLYLYWLPKRTEFALQIVLSPCCRCCWLLSGWDFCQWGTLWRNVYALQNVWSIILYSRRGIFQHQLCICFWHWLKSFWYSRSRSFMWIQIWLAKPDLIIEYAPSDIRSFCFKGSTPWLCLLRSSVKNVPSWVSDWIRALVNWQRFPLAISLINQNKLAYNQYIVH